MEKLSRRTFLTLTTVAGGMLAIRFPLSATALADNGNAAANPLPLGYLFIGDDNSLTLQFDRHEMGQGVHRGIKTLLAEALNTPPEAFAGVPAHTAETPWGYYQVQPVGGSASMREAWQSFRPVAAQLRDLLCAAGGAALGVSAANIIIKDGRLRAETGESIAFATAVPFLADAAAQLPAESVFNSPPYRFIGKTAAATELTAIVTGQRRYGFDRSDSRRPLKVAVIARRPNNTASLEGYDRRAALDTAGVLEVLETFQGVAVIAEHTWAALQGQRALKPRWQVDAEFNSDSLQRDLTALLDPSAATETIETRNVSGSDKRQLSRDYYLAMVSQAPLEPLACTVDLSESACRIWAGTQRPERVATMAARITGLPESQITLYDEYSGGSFGRRLALDFIVEAVALAKQLGGPVKVVWSREDMFTAGLGRPPAAIRVAGYPGPEGELQGLYHKVASPGKLWYDFPGQLSDGTVPLAKHYVKQLLQWVKEPDPLAKGVSPSTEVGGSALDGVLQSPYGFAKSLVEHQPIQLDIPVGFWRAVGHGLNVFAREAYLDEWAREHQQDPLQLRRQHLATTPRLRETLDQLADWVGWHQRSESHPIGLASFAGYGSYISTAVVLDNQSNDQPRAAHIYCVVDCGQVINPDVVKAQIEGGVIMGLSVALRESLDVNQGRITSQNFDQYPLLRMGDTPDIQVKLVDSTESPGGVGELGVPGVAPALVNAWLLKTGQAIRQLPILPG